MEKITLIVVTDDREYGMALSKALQQLCGGVVIRLLGKEQFFVRMRAEGAAAVKPWLDSADVILWDGDEAKTAYGGRLVMLSDKPAMLVRNCRDKRFCLYKYSPAQTMAASLFEICGVLSGKRRANVSRQTTDLLAFTSWSGGSGCTSLALAVAQELRRFAGKRVLYVSFEETESTGEFMGSPAGMRGSGVYLYHLFKGDVRTLAGRDAEAVSPAVEGFVIHDDFGVEAFAPTAGRNPLAELAADEAEILVASLIDSGRYDVMIMDLGDSLSETAMSCMEMAERICLVSGGDCRSREEQYIQHIMRCCGEDIVEKTIKVRNMAPAGADAEEAAHEGEEMIETGLRIERSSTFLQRGETKRIFLDGAFGQSIRTLTARLTEGFADACRS